MITLRARLGGRPITALAPELDEDPGLWVPRLMADFPTGVPQLVGIDMEGRWMGGAGVWSPDWAMRTLQLAPDDDHGWVLRQDDMDQVLAAHAVLSDLSKEFTSHTQVDTHAVLVAFGVDIMGRFLDAHPYAIMSQPDDRAGQADLKSVAARLGMPELKAADDELTGSGRSTDPLEVKDGLFGKLYREAHPELGRRAISTTNREAHGFDHCPVDHPLFVKYAAMDAIAVRRVAPQLIRQLGERGTPAHLLANERWLSEQVTRGKARGLLVDTERLEAMQARTGAVVERAEADMVEVTGLKPTQNVKLVKWFGEHIAGGWPSDHPRTDSGAPALGDNAYHRLRRYELDEAAQRALDVYSGWVEVSNQHTLSAQVRNALDPRGLIHPTVYSVGTITSRMSSAGPNAQNWAKPKDVDDAAREQRELVLPGHPDLGPRVFISCDFSQVEYRAAAALSGEPVLIETIMTGGDLHQLTADRIGITRQHAKTVNFAVLYGTGGAKLAKIMNYAITEDEGKDIVRAYWEAYPKLNELRGRLMTQKGVRLFSGRWVPTGRITKGERAGQDTVWANLNYLIQGNCRELLVGAWMAVWRVFQANPQWGAEVRLPIHDELLVSCRWEHRAEVCAALESAMSFEFFGVPITAEADVLVDEAGVSRWMTGDVARKIREAA